jgi:hypothetical protein
VLYINGERGLGVGALVLAVLALAGIVLSAR